MSPTSPIATAPAWSRWAGSGTRSRSRSRRATSSARAAGRPYAGGAIIRSTEDDFVKLERARGVIERRIAARGPEAIFNFSGLERALPMEASELAVADDEVAPALAGARVRALALEHLGGDAERHDVMLFNRLTAATFATHLALVSPGDAVLGLSPSYTHPTAIRSARQCGARFVETGDLAGLAAALDREPRVSLVVLTRLAVTYDLLPLEIASEAVRLAHARGVRVYVDDARGARGGPARFRPPPNPQPGARPRAPRPHKERPRRPPPGPPARGAGPGGRPPPRAVGFR